MNHTMSTQKNTMRNSSIEGLKIFAIILIILSHVLNTLLSNYGYIENPEYLLDLNMATSNLQFLICTLLSYLGEVGVNIFFICSVWFLLEKQECSIKKAFYIEGDSWTISVLILIFVLVIHPVTLSKTVILHQIFPTINLNNWYVTCYILLLLIYPILNKIIRFLNQKSLLKLSLGITVFYVILNTFWDSNFSSRIILWITFYFVIAYLKRYCPQLMSSRRINLIVLLSSIVILSGLVILTNFLGLHFSRFQYKNFFWYSSSSPFLFLIALTIFNLFKDSSFKNKCINKISSLTLYIYVIHENQLFRSIYRPRLWNAIYQRFGYSHILFWVFILTFLIFAFSLGLSYFYQIFLKNTVHEIWDRIYLICKKIYRCLERKILQIG
jgi:surface polysaccharide O-acyltransferase-like enzyme